MADVLVINKIDAASAADVDVAAAGLRAVNPRAPVLPALGYGPAQSQALAQTINAASADIVVSATPIDLAHLLRIDEPIIRASYEYAETGEPRLSAIVDASVDDNVKPAAAPAAAQRN